MARETLWTALLLAAPLWAQPCEPQWINTLGTPGLTDGYAGPTFVWNDGNGDDLYVGGSFTSIAGRPWRLLARYEASTNTFARVGAGLGTGSTNGFLTTFAAFNPGGGEELIVGGFFNDAAGIANSSSLVRWNGSRWATLDANWTAPTGGSVWALTVWQGGLYVGGGYTSIGPLTSANGIARWDGEAWQNVGAGYSGGFSPNVFTLRVFDDGSGEKLYAGGRFAALGGVPGLIARWNGSDWEDVGDGIFGGTFAGVECSAVFNDGTGPALYVGGADLSIPGFPLCSIAKWNGTSWTPVGQYLGGRTTALLPWDDGTGLALYASGTAQPGINYLARLEGNTWVPYDGGVGGASVPPATSPPCSGSEHTAATSSSPATSHASAKTAAIVANGLAEHSACLSEPCPPDLTGSSDPNDPQYGTPDGTVDIADFFFYLDQFAADNLAVADLTGSSDPNDPGYGTPDGTIDIADFFFYLDQFVVGC
jgi:hypothetical protein